MNDDALHPMHCVFCPTSRFLMNRILDLPGEDGILWEDEHTYVAPDVAPLTPGHVLIISKQHTLSAAKCQPRTLKSIREAQRTLAGLYARQLGKDAVFFEHGPSASDQAGSCVDHTHIHAVPVTYEARQSIRLALPEMDRVDDAGLSAFARRAQSYLYFADAEGGFAGPVGTLPCQYLRLTVATVLALDEWKWQARCRTAESRMAYHQTLAMFRGVVDAFA